MVNLHLYESSNILLAGLLSFIFWAALYLWSTLIWPNEVPEFYSRVISLLHGSVAAYVGLSQCKVTQISVDRLHSPVSIQAQALMVWSWGYFALDLLWCLCYWPKNYVMNIHHLFSVISITIYMHKKNSGCIYPCGIAFMEITNPMLQIRWFLKNSGYSGTPIFTFVEIFYLVSFIGLRGIFGTYLIVKIFTSNHIDFQGKIVSLALYLVSMALIMEIIGYVIYRYRTKINEFRGILDETGIILNDRY